MACSHQLQQHLRFEVRVVGLRNSHLDLQGNLFIRYYFSADNGRRIRVDTREIQSTGNPTWDEIGVFDCSGRFDSTCSMLESKSIVFELRWRRRPTSVLRRMVRAQSKLLGRGEMCWKDVFAARAMSVQKLVKFSSASHKAEGVTSLPPPELLVEMKARISGEARSRKACDCAQCRWIGTEEDMFINSDIVK